MKKTPVSKFAEILQTPVYPKTLHQFRPDPKATKPNAKSPTRDNIFSKSRDTHEDGGTRRMKNSQSSQSFPHVR